MSEEILPVNPQERVIRFMLPPAATGSPLRTVWFSPYATGLRIREKASMPEVAIILCLLPGVAAAAAAFSSMGFGGASGGLAIGLAVGAFFSALLVELVALAPYAFIAHLLQAGMKGTSNFWTTFTACVFGMLPLLFAAIFMIAATGLMGRFAGLRVMDSYAADPYMAFLPFFGGLLTVPVFLIASIWNLVALSNTLAGAAQLPPWTGFGIYTGSYALAAFLLPFILPLLMFLPFLSMLPMMAQF
ncbi:MAG: hypothetical protein GC168_07480 [Candidatus Hydrogenedens sp.]|nr:hypothetical protein [Candidatus Hydrogenedens sp.]